MPGQFIDRSTVSLAHIAPIPQRFIMFARRLGECNQTLSGAFDLDNDYPGSTRSAGTAPQR